MIYPTFYRKGFALNKIVGNKHYYVSIKGYHALLKHPKIVLGRMKESLDRQQKTN